MLSRRLDSLAANYSAAGMGDPMMIFTFVMGQGVVVRLGDIALGACVGDASGGFEYGLMVGESRGRAVRAAREIGILVREHDRIGYFKVGLLPAKAYSMHRL